jgi:dTDP-4-amino-4,6-dideoxygalactose transaminase
MNGALLWDDCGAIEMHPRAWPMFADDEVAAAARVLRSGKVNAWFGEETSSFEREYAAFTLSRHAVAVANGTVALELALRALGIGEGHEVITSPRTYIASASCAVTVGARPVFADVDQTSQNITAETIRAALTPATRAIIAVHLAGWPCDMDPILALAREHGIKVIEDCAQAHGATYKGRPVGSMGDAGAFSFCQDKIISTAGEGGMVTLNSESAWESAWAYKDHGKSYKAVYSASGPGFKWVHETFGTNWRLTEIQSAIGRLQLRKLPEWLNKRRENAAMLTDVFNRLPGLRVTAPSEHSEHAFYKYYAFVIPEALRPDWSRDRIIAAIVERGVPCYAGSCSEVYLEKAFPQAWRPATRLPNAHALGETSLAFQVHPALTREDINRTCAVVRAVMAQATR